MSKVYQNSKILCCQLDQMTFWNTMRPGVLYSKNATNAGYGPLCAEEQDRSLLLQLATEVKRLVSDYGNEFLKTIVDAFLIVISGKLIKRFFLMKSIIQLAKTADRFHIWNDGTAPYANTRHAMSAKPSPFPRRIVSITW